MGETNNRAMECQRGALVRVSDPHSRHSVHNTAADMWLARAKRLIETHLGTAVKKPGDKNLHLSPMAKNITFSGLVGEKRTTPRVTCRPLNDGSTRYLRGRHVHSLALPDTIGAERGFIPCRYSTAIVAWAVFKQRGTNFQRRSPSLRCVQTRLNN